MTYYSRLTTVPMLGFILLAVLAVVILRAFGFDALAPAALGAGFVPFFGISDAAMIFRDGAAEGNLTATETGAAINDGPYPLSGMPFRLYVPAISSGDTIRVTIEESATQAGTYIVCGQIGDDTLATLGTYWGLVKSTQPWHRYVITVTGNGSENFGAVDLRAVSGFEYTAANAE